MLKVMSCHFCNETYRIGEFRKVIEISPGRDKMDGAKPKNIMVKVSVCKTCYNTLKSGKALGIQQVEESIEDKVREIVQEETEID